MLDDAACPDSEFRVLGAEKYEGDLEGEIKCSMVSILLDKADKTANNSSTLAESIMLIMNTSNPKIREF